MDEHQRHGKKGMALTCLKLIWKELDEVRKGVLVTHTEEDDTKSNLPQQLSLLSAEMDFAQLDVIEGLRWSWNSWPVSKTESNNLKNLVHNWETSNNGLAKSNSSSSSLLSSLD
ncbi:hypothetical protein L1987_43092 [Smallanthus sonchifolius]|uniref:Uncharacterized protein n=1 Tax=Smallanthus sonchifolius TaxID=185202 RepID=A0ACB9GLX6_9ASTR|nr:hypothetical protein L1987_43092 [Smallanthus sonchifolius]